MPDQHAIGVFRDPLGRKSGANPKHLSDGPTASAAAGVRAPDVWPIDPRPIAASSTISIAAKGARTLRTAGQ